METKQAILSLLREDRFIAWQGERTRIAEACGVGPNVVAAYMTIFMAEGLVERNGTSGDIAYRLTAAGAALRDSL